MNIEGAQTAGASGRILTADTMDAHNTFEDPQALVPADYAGRASGDRVVFELPPKSTAVVRLARGPR